MKENNKDSKQNLEEQESEALEINLLELEIDFTVLPDFGLDIPELDLTKLNIEMPEINTDFPKMDLPEMSIDISDFLEVLNFDLPDFDLFIEE